MSNFSAIVKRAPILVLALLSHACGGSPSAEVGAVAQLTEDTCIEIRYPAPSGSSSDVVFAFDKPYKCGQYINGDWWVSVESEDAVVITSVTPTTTPGRNGLELNPASPVSQGFDDRMVGFDSGLLPAFPVSIARATSVVKAVSLSDPNPNCRPCLQFAAVLTVVEDAVINSHNAFRPAYFGSVKFSHRLVSSALTSLPTYSSLCCETTSGDFSEISERYKNVQLDHIAGWQGRELHPIDNMPDYGAQIATDNAAFLLRMLLDDFNINDSIHRSALSGYIQMGIDIAAMKKGGVLWAGAGGHTNGRKLPLLIAGALLEDSEMLTLVQASGFSEDDQVYTSGQAGIALYGRPCTEAEYWKTTKDGNGARDCRDPYGYVDGGGFEIGGAYQLCCTSMPWKYTSLVVRMLGLEQEWGNDAFHEYVDRWMNFGVWASPDPCAPYSSAYESKGSDDCVSGNGRYVVEHGTRRGEGGYRSTFGDAIWDEFRSQL